MRRDQLKREGIHVKNFNKVLEQVRLLQDALLAFGITCSSTGDRQSIVLSVCAGMIDKVYTLSGLRAKSLQSNDMREIDKSSVVTCEEDTYVVGIPFDIGRHRLLTMNTLVSLDQLREVAPSLLQVSVGVNPYYDERRRTVMSCNTVCFGDSVLSSEERPDPKHPDAARVFAEWVADRMLNAAA